MTHVNPSFTQRGQRADADSSTGVNSLTALATENSNLTIDVSSGNVIFILRTELEETAGGSGVQVGDLEYSIGGGGFNPLGTATTGARITSSHSCTSSDAAATTNVLTTSSASFIAGEFDNNASTTGPTFAGNDHSEFAHAIELVAADLSNNDTLQFRIAGVAAWDNTITITIQKPTTVSVGIISETSSALGLVSETIVSVGIVSETTASLQLAKIVGLVEEGDIPYFLQLPASGNAFSDTFPPPGLKPGWTKNEPSGGTVSFVDNGTDGEVKFALDGSISAIPHTSVSNGLLISQSIDDRDFTLEAKFNSVPIRNIEQQGILAIQDDTNFIRWGIYSVSSVTRYVLAIHTSDGTPTAKIDTQIGSDNIPYLRLVRNGDTFTCYSSEDGITFTNRGSFTASLTISETACWGGHTSSSPATETLVDYFVFNHIDVRLGLETDTALSVTPVTTGGQNVTIGIASEANSSLSINSILSLDVVAESNATFGITAEKTVTVGQASEGNTTLSLIGTLTIQVGVASENSASLKLSKIVGVALELDSISSISSSKVIGLGFATETDAVFSVRGPIVLGVSLETSVPLTVSLFKSYGSGILAVEVKHDLGSNVVVLEHSTRISLDLGSSQLDFVIED